MILNLGEDDKHANSCSERKHKYRDVKICIYFGEDFFRCRLAYREKLCQAVVPANAAIKSRPRSRAGPIRLCAQSRIRRPTASASGLNRLHQIELDPKVEAVQYRLALLGLFVDPLCALIDFLRSFIYKLLPCCFFRGRPSLLGGFSSPPSPLS